jgi:hypothetical protein
MEGDGWEEMADAASLGVFDTVERSWCGGQMIHDNGRMWRGMAIGLACTCVCRQTLTIAKLWPNLFFFPCCGFKLHVSQLIKG